MTRWRVAVAAGGGAVLVLAAGVLVTASALGGGIEVAEDYGPDDGLNRFVVTLADGAAAAATTAPTAEATPAPGSDVQGSSDDATVPDGASVLTDTSGTPVAVSNGPRLRVDLERLGAAQLALGADGSLVPVGDEIFWVTPQGSQDVSEGSAGAATLDPAVAPDLEALGPLAAHARGDDGAVSATGSATPDALTALAGRPGVVSAQRLEGGSSILVATDLVLEEVLALPEVATAEPSVSVPVMGTAPTAGGVSADPADPTDPLFAPYGWNLHNTGRNAYDQQATAGADVEAPTGWLTTQGQGAVVAVVDTGFDTDHPDLAGVLWTNPTEACGGVDTNGNGKAGDCHGWNFTTGTADVDNGTSGSHGTAVAGVVAARLGNGHGLAGVAPQAQIMPLVVGSGSSIDVYLAAEAIRYAADNGADAVNASFGGTFTGPALTALTAAVDYATARGVVVVAAAGNDAGNRDVSPVYPATLSNPLLVTVGSSTARDTVAAHSAYGATNVDLFAPGEKVAAPWNDGGYRVVTGTSFAAPHVAAAVALHRSVAPEASVAQVRDDILRQAERFGAFAGRCVSGGRLDLGTLTGASTPAGSTSYAFSRMSGAPGNQRPTVAVTSTATSGTYQVVLGLAMLVDGEIWAVADEDVTLGGQTYVTDDAGQVTVDLGALTAVGTRSLEPGLTLGAGAFGLTVQLLQDGVPLTRPYAAPLLVAAASDPGSTSPGAPGPADGAPPAPGSGPAPGSSPAPGATGPGATGPTAPGASPEPGVPGPGSPAPGTTQPGDPAPGGSSPVGPTSPPSDPSAPAAPGPGAPTATPAVPATPTTPGTPEAPGGPPPGPTPDPAPTPGMPGGGEEQYRDYANVGDFGVVRVSPVRVSTSGGDLVTIRGTSFDPRVGVRVGSTTPAHVLFVGPTTVVLFAPPAVAGTYDLTVHSPGRTSVLPGALTYLAPSDVPAGPDGSAPASPGTSPPPPSDPGSSASPAPGSPPGSPPGSAPSSPAPADPGPSSPAPANPAPANPAPSNPAPASPAPAPTSPPGAGGSTPQAPLATRQGPNGERLVRSDALAPLATLWSTACSATCPGVQV